MMAPITSETAAVVAHDAATSTTKRRSAASQNSLERSGAVVPPESGRGWADHLAGGHRPPLERVVTRGDVAVAERIKRRIVDIAVPFLEARAARMEPAAARRIDGARHVAFQHDALPSPSELRIGDRNRGEQCARIGVLRFRI